MKPNANVEIRTESTGTTWKTAMVSPVSEKPQKERGVPGECVQCTYVDLGKQQLAGEGQRQKQ